MLAGDLWSLGAYATVSRRNVGAVAAAVRPRSSGGAVIGVERGFALQDATGAVTTLDPVWTDGSLRLNEGGCDPQGRFYCGSMAYDQTPGAGALYRLDPDGTVAVVLQEVTISNGLGWSPDGALAYYADTATRRVDVFDYDAAGGLTGRRPFVRLAADANPDGLTVDADGGVWVALYGAGEVHHYTAEGRLEGVVDVPTPLVTACTFGGPGLDQLFITTSQENLTRGEHPLAGSLFQADVGVPGMPAREFAG